MIAADAPARVGGYPSAVVAVDELRQAAARLRDELAACQAVAGLAEAAVRKAVANRATIEARQSTNAAALVDLAATLTEVRRGSVAGEDRMADLASLNARRHELEAERDELDAQLGVAMDAAETSNAAAVDARWAVQAASLALEATDATIARGSCDRQLDAALAALFDAVARSDELDVRANAAALAIAERNAAAGRDGRPSVAVPEPVMLDLRRLPAMSRPHRPILL